MLLKISLPKLKIDDRPWSQAEPTNGDYIFNMNLFMM